MARYTLAPQGDGIFFIPSQLVDEGPAAYLASRLRVQLASEFR